MDLDPGRPVGTLRQRRWRRWSRFVLLQALATLFLCEVAVRLLTTTNAENGMLMIGRLVLLPYRPAAADVRSWLQRPAGNYVVPDHELGWTIKPGGHSPDSLYQANLDGARSRGGGRYDELPPPGRLRLVTVGDSFTHGDAVAFDDTWQRNMERGRSDLDVVNLGVPGYGTDQAYLRWRRDGSRLHPHVALLGIWPENICRNLNVVRFFMQPAGGFGFLSKPRFRFVDGRLDLLNEPVLRGEELFRAVIEPLGAPLLRHDYWAIPADLEPRSWYHLRAARVAATVASLYRRRRLRERLYAGENMDGIEVTTAIAEAFDHDALSHGAQPLVVLIPMLDLLARYPEENAFPLARALRERGIDVIDLGPPMARAVRELGPTCCYQEDRHLSAEGNKKVGAWLLERLEPRLDAIRAQLGD